MTIYQANSFYKLWFILSEKKDKFIMTDKYLLFFLAMKKFRICINKTCTHFRNFLAEFRESRLFRQSRHVGA